MMKYIALFALILFAVTHSAAQPDFYNGVHFNHRDSLLGGNRAERNCYNVLRYDLTIKVLPDEKRIIGSNRISYQAVFSFTTMQLDLFENMHLDSIVANGKQLKFTRDAGAVFVEFETGQNNGGTEHSLTVYYEGVPIAAKNAPWDGGFVWKTDPTGKPWIGVACEGDGASLWYPCKDGLNDEPDKGATVRLIVPEGLTAVSNGRNKGDKALDGGWHQFDWEVTYPINNYNINFTIGDFVHFSDVYTSKADGEKLDLDYWVLRNNLAIAKKHFEQVKPMLECYEHYLGKYPFWRDGYKLIETPYLGMEHQSGIAYGNQYMPRYLGGRVPAEFDFDFIIIHESGHEYFGNALTARDHADLWLHEAFTTYLETMYVEYLHDKDAGQRYIDSQAGFIKNKEPIVGPAGVRYNRWDDSDMYYKGAWVLHTLRNAVNDDAKFFAALRKYYTEHQYGFANTYDFAVALQQATGRDWSRVMEQYLTYPRIPTLVYSVKKPFLSNSVRIRYKYEANIWNFDMPIGLGFPNSFTRVNANNRTVQELCIKGIKPEDVQIDRTHFLVAVRREEKELKLPPPPKPAKQPKAAKK